MALSLVTKFAEPVTAGSYIGPELIEEVTGVDREHADYSLTVATLRKFIEAHVEALTGRRYVTRMSKSGIRVLNTSEARVYLHGSFESKLKSAELTHHKASVCVEPYLDELSDQERDLYRQRQHMNARILLHTKEVELSSLANGD